MRSRQGSWVGKGAGRHSGGRAGGFDTQMPCDHLSSSTPTDRGELGQIFFSCFYNPQTPKALTQLSSSF